MFPREDATLVGNQVHPQSQYICNKADFSGVWPVVLQITDQKEKCQFNTKESLTAAQKSFPPALLHIQFQFRTELTIVP